MKRLLLLGVLALAPCGVAVAAGELVAASTVTPTPTIAPATTTSAASPTPANTTQQASLTPAPSPTTGTPTSSSPTAGESWAAALAVLGAIGLGSGILWLVNRTHTLQKTIAQSTIRRGGTAQVALQSAAGHNEVAAVGGTLTITGPDEVQVNTAEEFTLEPVETPEWSVSGISAYARDLGGPRTFVFTPHEEKDAVTITVRGVVGDPAARPSRCCLRPPPGAFRA